MRSYYTNKTKTMLYNHNIKIFSSIFIFHFSFKISLHILIQAQHIRMKFKGKFKDICS